MSPRRRAAVVLALLVVGRGPFASGQSPAARRDAFPLDGTWRIAPGVRPDAAAFRPVVVPDAFETALGDDFDGVATYRRDVVLPEDFGGERIFLAFEAAAAHAVVRWNGREVGRHLGGWTPFRCEITTDAARGVVHRLEVEVDERVGHDTQGFLPIVLPHFGGLWGSVRVVGVPATALDEDALLAFGDGAARELVVEAPLIPGSAPAARVEATLVVDGQATVAALGPGRTRVPAPAAALWSPAAPRLHDVVLRALDAEGRELDRVATRVGFRSIAADGRRLLLNGAPFNVRGILEWGVATPSRSPRVASADFARRLREAKARGFNLIKFCLWIPPRALLDLCDEIGMAAWVEYPTWHARFAPETRDQLLAEYDAFFRHDRSRPSVCVRSLTCESGTTAPLDAMQALYARAHAAIPNAFVEDDSSWIAWNRVHDFWDDHPYGNNDAWPAALDALERHIAERRSLPLLLGEAIAADTWLDRATVRDFPPARRPLCFEALEAWEERVAARFGRESTLRLGPESLRYGLAQRKDQIETFRLLQPDGGYVVSVARDFRLASMGLADAFDRWKWSPEAWAWHGDVMLLLGRGTPRAFASGGDVRLDLFVANHGATPLPEGRASWRVEGQAYGELPHEAIPPGVVRPLGTIAFRAPEARRFRFDEVIARIGGGAATRENRWPVVFLPTADPDQTAGPEDAVVTADALSPALLGRLEAGARVLLEATDRRGSFVAPSRWTLRGSPWMPEHSLTRRIGRDALVELLVKDLHPRGMVPLARLFEHVTPLVGFWDTHDHPRVDDYGLVFETSVGAGRLLVTTLPIAGSAAATAFGAACKDHLRSGPPPHVALPPSLVRAMKDRLALRTFDLTGSDAWRLRPEPDGGEAGAWRSIKVGVAWEGQGLPDLDGLARYRLEFALDDAWTGKPLHLALDGVDDAYEVFFDGRPCGSGGDVARRVTAFDIKACHLLTDALPAGPHVLEILVRDWQGAGGLHRPVRLTSAPVDERVDFLVAD